MNSLTILKSANAVFGRLTPTLTAQIARRIMMTPRRTKPRLWENAGTMHAERFTLKNGLSALRWGHSGPIVLCLHGWEGRASQFSEFNLPLTTEGFQVIAIDAPAHGCSPGKEANPLVFTQALLEAGEELGPVAMTIGHSMGASATALAISRGLDVQAAVIIAGPASLKDVLNRFANYVGLPERARQRFLGIVEKHTDAPLHTVEIGHLAKSFTIPCLVIHDSKDRVVPFSDSYRIAGNWPGSQLLATTGLGHFQALRSKPLIDTIVTFARQLNTWDIAA